MPKDEMTREEALAGLGEAARVLALYNPELATHAREALTVLSAPVPVGEVMPLKELAWSIINELSADEAEELLAEERAAITAAAERALLERIEAHAQELLGNGRFKRKADAESNVLYALRSKLNRPKGAVSNG